MDSAGNAALRKKADLYDRYAGIQAFLGLAMGLGPPILLTARPYQTHWCRCTWAPKVLRQSNPIFICDLKAKKKSEPSGPLLIDIRPWCVSSMLNLQAIVDAVFFAFIVCRGCPSARCEKHNTIQLRASLKTGYGHLIAAAGWRFHYSFVMHDILRRWPPSSKADISLTPQPYRPGSRELFPSPEDSSQCASKAHWPPPHIEFWRVLETGHRITRHRMVVDIQRAAIVCNNMHSTTQLPSKRGCGNQSSSAHLA